MLVIGASHQSFAIPAYEAVQRPSTASGDERSDADNAPYGL